MQPHKAALLFEGFEPPPVHEPRIDAMVRRHLVESFLVWTGQGVYCTASSWDLSVKANVGAAEVVRVSSGSPRPSVASPLSGVLDHS